MVGELLVGLVLLSAIVPGQVRPGDRRPGQDLAGNRMSLELADSGSAASPLFCRLSFFQLCKYLQQLGNSPGMFLFLA